ncbi:hypothetical protein WJX73_004560 [Symbiochloris irregularis]|uniref:Crossover junction endonuclease MUS81 n=1 Tax=Symbiochloris irregularis TaxID=706552 RepID=A0AAW1PG60_9CHLO
MSGRSERLNKDHAAAQRAKRALSSSNGLSTVANQGNALLFLFFRELQEDEKQKEDYGENPIRHALSLAAKSIKAHPLRCCDEKTLGAVKGIGPAMCKRVASGLWSLYPPADLSEEEQHLKQQQELSSALEAQAKKEQAKKRKADQKRQEQALAQEPMRRQAAAVTTEEDDEYGGGQFQAELLGYGQDDEPLEGGGTRKKQRKPKEKKGYCPNIGTANYAFMVILYQAHLRGELPIGKNELMDRAETSGLSDKAIRGNQSRGQQNGQLYFDGWSSFKRLKNGPPPLVSATSSPLQIKLMFPEGVELGKQLYDNAVMRNAIVPEPGAESGGFCTSAPSFQAAASPKHQQAIVKPGRSSSADTAGRAAGADQGVNSAEVAMLVDMGFDADLAAKALKGGRGMEDAIDLLASGALEGLDDVPAADTASPHPHEGVQGAARPPPGNAPARAPQEQHQAQPARSSAPQAHAPAAQRCAAAAELRAAAGSSAATAAPAMPGPSSRPAPVHLDSQGDGGSQAQASGSGHSGRSTRGTWRLPGVGGAWGIEETNIRLPPLAPGARFEDHYEIALVVDQREQFQRGPGQGRAGGRDDCLRILKMICPHVSVATLKTGDIMWVARPKWRGGYTSPEQEGHDVFVLDTLVERKSCDDLLQSIHQNRYMTQKYYMRRSGVRRLMYLIEGDPDVMADGTGRQAVKSAGLATEIIDGFTVLRTRDVLSTFRLYAKITKALQEKYRYLTPESPSVQKGGDPLPTFNQVQDTVNLAHKRTVKDVWGLMLTAVPAVGADVSEAILRVYPTPVSLWRAYRDRMLQAQAQSKSVVAEATALLVGIPVGPGRTIGNRQASNVFTSMFANGWMPVA